MALLALESDVATAKAAMESAYSVVVQFATRASTDGRLTAALYSRTAALVDRVQKVREAGTFWGANFQNIIAQATAVHRDCFALGGELAALYGEKNPVAPPPGELTLWPFAVAAAVAAGLLFFLMRGGGK